MAPKKEKEMSKSEGKKPMQSAIDKKKSRAKKVPLIMLPPYFVKNENQNPHHEDEKVVGWVLTDSLRKNGAVIWYRAKSIGNVLTCAEDEVILSKVSGVGMPADFPPASLSERDLASGRITQVVPLPAWAWKCYVPKGLIM
jgi:hypothetical protein